MLVRTVVDYQYSWDLYFPTASTVAATQVPNVRKVETIVYFAAPLFSQAEWQWNSTLAKKLESEDVEVVLPQESALPMLSGQQQFDAAKLFATNIADIERCNVVVAILDGADPDSGTSWEVGYAHKLGRPIIGIRTDLRSGGDDPTASVNLMLAQSCSKMIVVPPDKRTDIEWLATEISNASAEIIGRSVP